MTRRSALASCIVAAVAALLPSHVSGATWYLSPAGNDATGDGSLEAPWFEIEAAMARPQVQAGDELVLLDGLYYHAGDKQSITNRRFDPNNPVTIRAANRGQAILQFDGDPPGGNTDDEGVGIHGCTGIALDGLEIRGGGDNTLHIGTDCSYITVRHCIVHEAGSDGDAIKINHCDHITIDNCIVYDPGRRRGSMAWTWQENIDILGSSDCVVRNCLLFHTSRGGDTMLYAKVDCVGIVFENNVLIDQYEGARFPPVTLGGTLHSEPAQLIDDGTIGDDGPPPQPDPNVYSCTDVIFRNNLIVRATRGSLGLFAVRNAWVVHNTFIDCDGGGIWVLAESNDTRTSRDCYVHNNIFYDSRGQMGGIYRRGLTANGLPMILYNFDASHNLFYNAGQPIPATGFRDANTEIAAVFADPLLADPTNLGHDWSAAVAAAALQEGSPAVNAGKDVATQVPTDVDGTPRPVGVAFDLGLHERVIPGDVDFDGEVSVLDIVALVAAFSTRPGDPGWFPEGDLDGDNEITVLDVVTVVNNFGRSM